MCQWSGWGECAMYVSRVGGVRCGVGGVKYECGECEGMLGFIPLLFALQGLLPFEIERVSEGLEEGGNTETAMDEFQEGSLDSSTKSVEYSQQRDIYTQNKPRKKKKATDREWVGSTLPLWVGVVFVQQCVSSHEIPHNQ